MPIGVREVSPAIITTACHVRPPSFLITSPEETLYDEGSTNNVNNAEETKAPPVSFRCKSRDSP